MKAYAHGWVGRDEEPVAILVIDGLALMMRVNRASPAPVAVHDKKAIGPRPLPMFHCSYCTRRGLGLVSSRRSDDRNNEMRGKEKVVFLLFATR